MSSLLPQINIEKVTSTADSLPSQQIWRGDSSYHGNRSLARLPGDVCRRYYTGQQQRPLGLLPNRSKKMDTWKRLSLLHYTPEPKVKQDLHHAGAEVLNASTPCRPIPSRSGVISARVNFIRCKSSRCDHPTAYASQPKSIPLELKDELDEEYVQTLAQIDLSQHMIRNDVNQERILLLDEDNLHVHVAPRESNQLLFSDKRYAKLSRKSQDKSNLEYLSFSWQAQLNKRFLTSDARDPLDYEPCERCRLRGTRCSRCIAIRTGGGYIILDGLESDSAIARYKREKGWGFNSGDIDDNSWSRLRRRKTDSNNAAGSGLLDGREGKDGSTDKLGGSLRQGSGWEWERGYDGWKNDYTGGGEGKPTRPNQYSDNQQINGNEKESGNSGRLTETKNKMLHDNERSQTDGDNRTSTFQRSDSTRRMATDHDMYDGDDEREKRLRIGSSRPRSSMQENNSSKSKRDGEDNDQSNRLNEKDHRNTKLKKEGAGRYRKGGGGSDDNDDDDNDAKKQQRHRKSSAKRRTSDTENDDDHKRSQLGRYKHLGRVQEGDSDEDDTQKSRSDLMRFKSKRDNVKAKECTLKELEGIDPLDYLAKYCIIDQSKVPHYQQVFNNVDRDEDELLTIPELDFALKAVNYNLISDSEMEYVNSVLELAGRYALNFQLFSLVAALSERVVALDDMVKRLINSMDFEALETKMKKCKELFYLLANDKEGVVKTSDLAIELQAGGLTQEHVEFVTERLNHEGKGRVEFLDYLTYVPLFIEIHDNINDNPLDFTRNR